ncbi:MAG: hypothetical protein IK093_00225, partial [Ruminiclostridium sp.]|nr:hypothetical protein [Ruminiclostridium sp.]
MKTHSVLLKSTAVTVAALIAFGGCNNSAKPAETSYDTQMPETSAAAPGTAVQTTAPEQAADNTDTDEISGSAVTSPALETSDVSEPTEAQEPEEETSVAGTYVYIATSGYLSKKEVTEEHILATVENALEYYKEKGKYKGIVINEDGSGVAHLEQNSKNVLLEDGRYYDYRGGCAFELDGNILSVGLPDSSTYWSIYYKLSDEQIAGLPEPAGEFMENNYIIKIPTDSRNQQNVLLNAINTLFDAGEDPNDHLDELTELVKETAKEEKQKLDERRAHAEYTADLSFYDKQLSITDINRLNDGNVQICTDKNGNVSFICGTCTDSPIENEQDAYNAIEAVMTLIGGDEDTKFEFLNMFTDIYGFSYYTFLDYDKYGAVDDRIIAKVMVNKDNKMVALSAAFLPEDNIIDDSTLSEEGEPLPLTADDLSEIVYKNCGYDRSLITVYDELTETKLISRTKEITSDDYFNTEDPCWHQKVWIVYTNAPGNEKYPYLAHYITFSGRYLHNIPVSEPADEAALFGYDTVYTFDGMTAEEWTGQVVYPDGREETVTVPVMKDNETGKYYLAD